MRILTRLYGMVYVLYDIQHRFQSGQKNIQLFGELDFELAGGQS